MSQQDSGSDARRARSSSPAAAGVEHDSRGRSAPMRRSAIQSDRLPPHVLDNTRSGRVPNSTARPADIDNQSGHIPQLYFEYAQRTLSTLIIAGTFMAGVETQLLSLIFSAEDGVQRSVSIAFAVAAMLATAFAALYCAVTYVWMRSEWKDGPKHFQKWVAGSLSMMIVWSSTFLVIGIYSGFVALMFFLFAAAPQWVAIFSVFAFLFFGVGPMTWGFYYWYGLHKGWLDWTPNEDGEDGSNPYRRS